MSTSQMLQLQNISTVLFTHKKTKLDY